MGGEGSDDEEDDEEEENEEDNKFINDVTLLRRGIPVRAERGLQLGGRGEHETSTETLGRRTSTQTSHSPPASSSSSRFAISFSCFSSLSLRMHSWLSLSACFLNSILSFSAESSRRL